MKIAINKKYKYLTFEEHCPENENFEKWVMQDKFETHSVIEIPDDVDKEKLRFDQFDYDAKTDTFVFNREKYNEFVKELAKSIPPTLEERISALEMLELERILGGIEE